MKNVPTLTVKLMDDGGLLDRFINRPFTEQEKQFIRDLVVMTVQEYTKNQKDPYSSPDRIMRLPEVKRVTGIGSSSIWLNVKNGSFPKPVRLGARSIGWKESQISQWLEKRDSM